MPKSERGIKPNFFIVGPAHSGTTALYSFLRQHPDVFMPEMKEPQFFSRDINRERDRYYGKKIDEHFRRRDYYRSRIRTEKDYLDLFSGWRGEKAIGEASTDYLPSKAATRKIHRFNPRAKIIIMLRDPVDRLYSEYKNQLWAGLGTAKTFTEHVSRMMEFLPEFSARIKGYLDLFGRNQVRIVVYDDFKNDNAGVYREVLEFLEVDPNFRPDFKPLNVSRTPRFASLHNRIKFSALARVFSLRPIVSVYKKVFATEDRSLAMAPGLKRELMKKFEPEAVRLGKIVGRDLVDLWGYNRKESISPGHKLFVFLPIFSKRDARKDPGVIPEFLSRLGYQTFIFCRRPPRGTGLKTKIIKLNLKNVLRYLKRDEGFRQTVLFYFIPHSMSHLLFFLSAKVYNPRTSIIVKTDGLPAYEEWSFWRKFVLGIGARFLYPSLIDRIVTEAPEYRDYLLRMFGWHGMGDMITVLPNGVDIKRFELGKRRRGFRSVFYAGTLSVPKGIHLLLEAFSSVAEAHPGWKLVLAGDADPGFRKELGRRKEKLGDRLELKGFLSGKELDQEFVDSDIYVFPSFTWKEGFNLSLLEAMASGTAVIAADKRMEGIGYALDYGRAGLLFRKGDAGHLARILSKLMGNSNLRRSKSDAARRRVGGEFDLEKIIERWAELLASIS